MENDDFIAQVTRRFKNITLEAQTKEKKIHTILSSRTWRTRLQVLEILFTSVRTGYSYGTNPNYIHNAYILWGQIIEQIYRECLMVYYYHYHLQPYFTISAGRQVAIGDIPRNDIYTNVEFDFLFTLSSIPAGLGYSATERAINEHTVIVEFKAPIVSQYKLRMSYDSRASRLDRYVEQVTTYLRVKNAVIGYLAIWNPEYQIIINVTRTKNADDTDDSFLVKEYTYTPLETEQITEIFSTSELIKTTGIPEFLSLMFRKLAATIYYSKRYSIIKNIMGKKRTFNLTIGK